MNVGMSTRSAECRLRGRLLGWRGLRTSGKAASYELPILFLESDGYDRLLYVLSPALSRARVGQGATVRVVVSKAIEGV